MTKTSNFKMGDPEQVFPIIEIKNDEDKYWYALGLKRARLIVKNFDAIKKFVESNQEAI